ncbi:hypothetical protein [Sporichthya sp.]|uniref:class I SAM-dependent methyltransferase n=1 Tax=Sporichthya sp. TaxID=65475 RepID=UPI0017D7E37B|nr:hypothetical protein [Sporichthya sp.]MBA3743430.1 hypothetical protein [Sporichthya sp.]
MTGAPQPSVRPSAPPKATKPQRSLASIRRRIIFSTAGRDGTFLEIGPSHYPTLPKRDGFPTKTADHASLEGLHAKYDGFENVDVSAIEEVDFVLTPGKPLSACVEGRYDVVVAAHVLEHTTSLIDFVNDCAQLLTPTGTLALFVPDHRYCFDRFRERSSLASVIDAATTESGVHSVGVMTEAALYAAWRGRTIAWTRGTDGAYEWIYTTEQARQYAAEFDPDIYADTHHWVFTPNHLRLLLHDLAELGHISLRETGFRESVGGCEFFIGLGPAGPGPALSRTALLLRSDADRRGLDEPEFELA